jgi:hypothetical protein
MLRAQLIGNIGTEPEMKYTAAGQSLLTFSVASNYRTKNQSGEWVDKAEWVRCTVFGKRASTSTRAHGYSSTVGWKHARGRTATGSQWPAWRSRQTRLSS